MLVGIFIYNQVLLLHQCCGETWKEKLGYDTNSNIYQPENENWDDDDRYERVHGGPRPKSETGSMATRQEVSAHSAI